MEAWIRFPIYIAVSFLVFVALLCFVLRRRAGARPWRAILGCGLLVVVGGMAFAKVGQNAGLPWWIYYTLPALLTVFLPPVLFRMWGREVVEYLLLSFLSAPVIHATFSFFVNWHDYMPFVRIPFVGELLG